MEGGSCELRARGLSAGFLGVNSAITNKPRLVGLTVESGLRKRTSRSELQKRLIRKSEEARFIGSDVHDQIFAWLSKIFYPMPESSLGILWPNRTQAK